MFRFLIFILFLLLSVVSQAEPDNYQNTHNTTSTNIDDTSAKATAADILLSLEKTDKIEAIDNNSMLTGSAELGFLYKTGNTHSADMKTGINLRLEKDHWLSTLDIDLLIKKADKYKPNSDSPHFKTTDQKWTVSSQTNYTLDNDEKHYLYGNAWYEENKFSSFINQSSISTGWGRHWYKTTSASLWGDIGPGFKRDQFRSTDSEPKKTVSSWIIQAQALYITKLGENIELKQDLSAKQAIKSGENSIYKAQTSITTRLISTLQLKFTFTANYNTDVEADKKNLDTQTSVTLVYNF